MMLFLFVWFIASTVSALNSGAAWKGDRAFVALKADGTAKAWGDVGRGGNAPADLTNVTAVYSTRLGNFAAVLKDGSVRAWGSSGYGATDVLLV